MLAFATLAQLVTLAQKSGKPTNPVAEGKQLYRLEMASWNGTDLLLARYKDKRDSVGGYFSYPAQQLTNCVFFSKGDNPRVLVTIAFDSTFALPKAQVDRQSRTLTPNERELYTIRRKARLLINQDTLFKTFAHTDLNLIPLVEGSSKKVYVLTGPQSSNVVLFGNDYLIEFDAKNEVMTRRRLHKNIISMPERNDSVAIVTTMHSHLPATGDFITATDICTLMLYEKFTQWKQHYVFSKNYVSIWDCQKNELNVLTRKAWDRISKSLEKKEGAK